MSQRARALLLIVVWLWAGLTPTPLASHPLDPALLELRESADGQVALLWRVPRAQPTNAPLRPTLPARCASRTEPSVSETASATLTIRWHVDCGPGSLVGEHVGVEGLRERKTEALVRIHLADGRLIQTVLRGDESLFRVPDRGSRFGVIKSYLALGFEHILTGLDHLAFVLGLVLLVRGRRRLLWTITAFTLGHSVTLSLAVLGLVRVPQAPVEALIAASIFVVAVELSRDGQREHWMRRMPWLMAVIFGLLHGLGFAGALAQVGLPAEEIPLALVAFNVGIELGQLIFVAVVLAARAGLHALPGRWPIAAAPVPAYTIGALAAFWVIDRVRGIFF
jgi:hydrogenase/urease accessory protein HupE